MGDETNQAKSGHERVTARAASCPRCGYDLEGARAAWNDSCPLTGVCSECGYGFEWADVLRTDRQIVPWFYEHARSWWRLDTAFRTWVVSLWPPAFWRGVQPHAAHRPLRLALWPLLLVGAVLACCLCIATVSWFVMKIRSGSSSDTVPAFAIVVWLRNLFEINFIWTGLSRVRPFVDLSAQIIAFNVAALGGCMVAPSHWRGRIRPAHFARVAMFGLAPIISLFAVVALVWCWRIASMPLVPWQPGQGLRAQQFMPWQQFPLAAPRWLELVTLRRANAADELFTLAWLLLWWWCALRIGLHVRQSTSLWVAAMLIALGAALLAGLQNGLLLAVLWGL